MGVGKWSWLFYVGVFGLVWRDGLDMGIVGGVKGVNGMGGSDDGRKSCIKNWR